MALLFRRLICRPVAVARNFSEATTVSSTKHKPQITEDELDSFEKNIILRHHKNNIPLIRSLLSELKENDNDSNLRQKLTVELAKLPNATHDRLLDYSNKPKEVMNFAFRELGEAKEFSEVAKHMNTFRMEHLSNYTGHKAYYLMGALAELEQALIQYALGALKEHNFQLVSVPDILPAEIIEGCGMQTDGERTQVYKIDSGQCLSGTSEMALAGFFTNEVLEESDLPIKVAAVSRCYRAETSGLHQEKGIYRVHQFTKVEMFALCGDSESEKMLQAFKDIEISLFRNLELNFRVLDMPPCELGAPAYEKYDIEAWMPGRKMWGEISSCSNCTDYQSQRLNIRYRTNSGNLKFVHTVNGTVAAIPRLLISLVESNQIGNNYIQMPKVLQHIKNIEIKKDKSIPEIKFNKYIKT